MKPCECGGRWYRHGKRKAKVVAAAVRYRCNECGTCITVRGGKVSTLRGRPQVRDDRHA